MLQSKIRGKFIFEPHGILADNPDLRMYRSKDLDLTGVQIWQMNV